MLSAALPHYMRPTVASMHQHAAPTEADWVMNALHDADRPAEEKLASPVEAWALDCRSDGCADVLH